MAYQRRSQRSLLRVRALPFHSLRHHFGSVAVNRASLVQVQAWMGHSHIQTTARYLHHRSQATDAALLAEAFARDTVGAGPTGTPVVHDRDASTVSQVTALLQLTIVFESGG